MNAVGIDVSKGRSTVAVSQPGGVTVAKPFVVRHTKKGIGDFVNYLNTLSGDTRIVMEHTGRYYEPMAQWLSGAGLYVCAVNPLLIKHFSNNSLRKVKTDKADAKKIARYALDNWCGLRQYTAMDKTRTELKTMNRQFGFYTKQKTAYKNNLVALIDQTYPNVNRLFASPARPDGSQKWVDFVETFWHVECVCNLSLAAFTDRYQKWCQKHGYNFQAEKAKDIHEASQDLIAMLPKDNLTKLFVKQAIDQLNVISKAVEELRSKMNELASTLPEYDVVMNMKGVGPSLGPQLMAEIGDIRRFEKRSAITAFAGVDPGRNESGDYVQDSVSTSKRGSPALRKTLFQVMDVLIKTAPQDDPVYTFMDKKRNEGKPYYVYMTAGANKFLRIYYGTVKAHLAKTKQGE